MIGQAVNFDIPTNQFGMVDDVVMDGILDRLGGGIGVEVGCWLGRITHKMASRGWKAYAVDTFDGGGSYLSEWMKANNFNVLEGFKQNLAGYEDKVTIVVGDSRQAWEEIPEKVDFVFIDADHRYSRVKEDIRNYLKIIKKGGVLAGHDLDKKEWDERFIEDDYVGGNHHGVAKAVMERFKDFNHAGRIWWVNV